MNRIQIRASQSGWRLFRNNSGLAWVGKPYKSGAPRTILLRNARRIRFGLALGSADLIGWHKITITPEWLGREVAIFTAIEVKTKRGIVTADQRNFLAAVNGSGGHGRVVRSEDELTDR